MKPGVQNVRSMAKGTRQYLTSASSHFIECSILPPDTLPMAFELHLEMKTGRNMVKP